MALPPAFTLDEVNQYAATVLNIDLHSEAEKCFLWIAERGLQLMHPDTPLPMNWTQVSGGEAAGNKRYYFNHQTGETLDSHPNTAKVKLLLVEEQQRKKQLEDKGAGEDYKQPNLAQGDKMTEGEWVETWDPSNMSRTEETIEYPKNNVRVAARGRDQALFSQKTTDVLAGGEANVVVSGLGSAIADAVQLVEELKNSGLVTVTKIYTSHGGRDHGAQRKSVRIEITVVKGKKFDAAYSKATGGPCFLCSPQLRDPLTIAISFMINPAPFRGCCQFTVNVWNQAVFLEGPLPCAIAQFEPPVEGGSTPWMTNLPLLLPNIEPRKNQIRILTLRNISRLTRLEDDFLRNCTFLKVAVFHDLPELTEVGMGWMDGCTALESITLSNLPMLSKVGDWFLFNCTSLTEVVFQDLPELTEVGGRWMDKCTALETITLSNLPKLSKVRDYFLSECTSLKEAVFQDLSELTEVGMGWMVGCSALETITISNLPKLSKVGGSFLLNCTSLKEAVFHDLPELTEVGKYWLSDCTALQSLRLESLPSLATVGVGFLDECTSQQSGAWRQQLESMLVRGH